MPQRVLVLGGTGFVGGRAAEVLRSDGHDVVTLARGAHHGPAGPPARVADRRDAGALRAAIGDERFDATLDFAAYDAAGVEALDRVPGFSPGRYVLVSSGSVCRVTTAPVMPYREDDGAYPLIPEPPAGSPDHGQWVYGAGKRAAEASASGLGERRGWNVLILRLPIVVGVGDSSLRTWGYLERMLDGGPVLVPGGGDQPVRFLWVEDVGRAMRVILGRGPLPSLTYHLAPPDSVPLRDVLERMATLVGRAVEFLPVDDAQLAAAGLGRECSPYSGRWVSVLDPGRAGRDWGFRGTPIAEYLESVVRGLLDSPPPASHPGYSGRDKELALARMLTATGA